MAQEARQVGLHHEGFLRDEGLVEGADFDVLGESQAFDVPSGEQFGHGEAVGGDAVGIGAQVGGEEGQGVEVLAHLHGFGGGSGHALVGIHRGPHGGHRDGIVFHHCKDLLLFYRFHRHGNHAVARCGRLVHDAPAPPAAVVRQGFHEVPHRGLAAAVVLVLGVEHPIAHVAVQGQHAETHAAVAAPGGEAPRLLAVAVQRIVVHGHHHGGLFHLYPLTFHFDRPLLLLAGQQLVAEGVYLDVEFLVGEGYADALGDVLHYALAHGDEVHLEAAQHRAVDGDGYLPEFVADSYALEIALLVAYAQQVVDLHVLEARAAAQAVGLSHLDAALALAHPQQFLALHLTGIGGGHRAVFHRCVGPFSHEGDAVDATLALPAAAGHGPPVAVVVILAVGEEWEGLSEFGLAQRVVVAERHSGGIEQRSLGLAQALYLDVHLARQGVAVDVYVFGLEAVEGTDLFPTLQREEGGAVTHAHRGAGGMALAVEVGDVHANDILERGLGAEFNAAVGLGSEGYVETAVGGGGQLAFGHGAAILVAPPAPPPAVEAAAFNTILYTRARNGDGAVAGSQAFDGARAAELRCRALRGFQSDHELGLLVFLHADAFAGQGAAIGAHFQRVESGDAVGGDGEAGAGDAEVVGGQPEGVAHLLPVGVAQQQTEFLAVGDAGLEAVAAVGQQGHLHLLARLVDGAVGAHFHSRLHSVFGLRRQPHKLGYQPVAVALGHELPAPVKVVEHEAVASVAVGGGACQHGAVALHAQLLPGDGQARGAVEQEAFAAVLDELHVGAVERVGHEALRPEIGLGRYHQDVASGLHRRQGQQGALLAVFPVARHRHVPLRQRLGGQQFGLGLLVVGVVLHIGDDAHIEMAGVAVGHPHQALPTGGQGAAFAAKVDAHSRDFLAQVGALHAAFALGEEGDGGVAPSQGVDVLAAPVALFGHTRVEQGV